MFNFGETNRSEKPVRQDWGWSASADIWNPKHNQEDGNYGFRTVGIWTIGTSNRTIVDFIEERLKELQYTVLGTEFSE